MSWKAWAQYAVCSLATDDRAVGGQAVCCRDSDDCAVVPVLRFVDLCAVRSGEARNRTLTPAVVASQGRSLVWDSALSAAWS